MSIVNDGPGATGNHDIAIDRYRRCHGLAADDGPDDPTPQLGDGAIRLSVPAHNPLPPISAASRCARVAKPVARHVCACVVCDAAGAISMVASSRLLWLTETKRLDASRPAPASVAGPAAAAREKTGSDSLESVWRKRFHQYARLTLPGLTLGTTQLTRHLDIPGQAVCPRFGLTFKDKPEIYCFGFPAGDLP